jgi:alkylation response protein AidB-like acyl-CoA dehydrogenase
MDPDLRPTLSAALDRALAALRALELGDRWEPRAADAIRKAGLGPIAVPDAAGGMGAGLAEAVRVLAALGSVDGSTGLGFAMHVHVTGAARESEGWPEDVRAGLWRAVVEEGALINAASTEEGGGSPARGAIPGTTASPSDDPSGWVLRGEKTWTTWLPALTHALVSARIADTEEVGLFLVDLSTEGVTRAEGFEALGMRGSASGRLRLDDVAVGDEALVSRREIGGPDPRGPAPHAWFAASVAAVYLGIGEGARAEVARWALSRRPGDGSLAVADIPTVQLRLGRLDAELRAARIVLLDVARRWDDGGPAARRALGADLELAKLVATRAAAAATDEALRIAGGPGFLSGRLERAFRDARAGLINPPLEDVALTGFARRVLDRERDPG